MQLSVIILNYNVRYFLEQCVLSVQKALENIDTEIIVVDNNSSDDSCLMMKQLFPQITLNENKENNENNKNNFSINKDKLEFSKIGFFFKSALLFVFAIALVIIFLSIAFILLSYILNIKLRFHKH